jgi:hypothetical protein
MKPIHQIIAIALTVACFAVELHLLRAHKNQLATAAIASAAVATGLLLLAWRLRKTEKLFVTVFNAFKAGLANVLGLLLIIYAALHIGWLGNHFASYTDNGSSLYPVLLVASFFCLPFFVIPFLYGKKPTGEVPPEVFVSTLSWNSKSNIQLFVDNDFDKEAIAIALGKQQWNWLPSLMVLNKYPTIKKMYLLVSEGAAKEFEGLSTADGHQDLDIYKYMLQRLGLQRVELHLIKVINPGNIVDFKKEAEKKLANLLNNHEYPDEKMLFDITGGTAVASVALILLAYKGKRRAVYLEQGTNKGPEIFNPDTQDFKELWQQILERL